MSAKIIVIANQKGGVGKTSITMTLAGTLANKNHKTLFWMQILKQQPLDGCQPLLMKNHFLLLLWVFISQEKRYIEKLKNL